LEKLGIALRLAVGLTIMAVGVGIFLIICVPLLPSRRLRIAACNVFGHLMGPAMLRMTSTTVPADAPQRLKDHFPAIYVSNHASIIDMFIAIWVCPLFTCGVAKKEIVYYPFFGQLYFMSGHLRVDRSNAKSAVVAMARLGELVRSKGLGIWIWAEGTRSRDGRLLPLKKGFAHMALATGLPIVPVVVKGAHKGWVKNTLIIRPSTVDIEVLPAISTAHWTAETLDEHIVEVHSAMNAALPADQKGAPMVLKVTPEVPAPAARQESRAGGSSGPSLGAQ